MPQKTENLKKIDNSENTSRVGAMVAIINILSSKGKNAISFKKMSNTKTT